jgi:PAS domain S-box-containing protein
MASVNEVVRPVSIVAEDDEGLNRLICKQLERRGMTLVGVHSGADAIAAIQQHPDCLLLLDYVLVDMDGRQLLDKLNNMGLCVPFVVMTGRGDERIAVEMMKLGARDYLVKQPDFLELVPPVVERVLGQLETEQKLGRAELTLRESEEKYRLVVENAGEAIIVAQDGKMVFANPRMSGITGYARKELLARPFVEFIHPDDHTLVVDGYRRRIAGLDISGRSEFRIVRRDGETRHVEGSAVRIDWLGRPATLNFLADITARKQAEEEIERLSRFPAENPNPVLRILSDGTLDYANPRSKLLVETLGFDLGARMPEAWQEQIQKALSSGRQCEFEETCGSTVYSLLLTPVAGQGYVNVYGRDVTGRKQAEQALRAAKERAQSYLDVAGVVLVALDARGRITLMNRCGCRLLGYSESELIGRDWFDVCVPERVRDEVKGVFSWLMVGAVKPVEYYEAQVVTRSGEERLIAWHNVALRDESGRATGTLSSGEDITARRQAEQEAQAERDQLRRILDGMPDGAYVVGQDCELQYVNPSLRARGGPVNGRKCFDYFHRRTEPCPDCTNPQVFAGAAMRREYTTKQGVTYEIQDVPVAGNDGRPARLVFMRDITARKRAEQRDRQHLEDTALLRDTALGFITLDPDADIYRYIAQRLAQLAGEAYIVVNSYDATQDEFCVRAIEGVGERAEAAIKLIGRPPVGMTFKLAPEELRDYSSSTLMKIEGGLPALSFGKLPKVVIAAVESVFRLGGIYAMSFYWQGKILGTVNIIMHKDGTMRDPAVVEAFVNQAAIAVRRKLDADELERHRLHLEDLVAARTRELTAAQEQLVQHGKLMTLGRVAGSVAHEIRNPLGAIKNASWFLQKNAADKLGGKSLRHLRLIDQNIDVANRAITAILDFTWRLQSEPKKCALRPMLERAMAEATMPATVNVHFDVKPGLPHVLVDDRQMVAVFRNLFTNAAQAMPGGGTLRVAARRNGTMIAVDVADTGSGIKPEHLARVFEPLFTTRDVGIGLGLAICKDFVEVNKGMISVMSEVGKGATFTVTLPTATENKLKTPNPKL